MGFFVSYKRIFCLLIPSGKIFVFKRENRNKMMTRKIFTFIFLIAVFFFLGFSCGNDGITHKNVTGKAGEVLVVIPDETWNGKVGNTMKPVLSNAQLSLPQEEPIFDVINIPPKAFKEIFKTTRNIINVRISPTLDSAKIEFKKDVWAWPQAVVNIQAQTQDSFIKIFNANSDKIVAFMLKAERDRLQMNYAKNYDKAIKNDLLKKFDIDLTVPVGFVIASQKADFMWLRYDTPDITQGIAIYTLPYTSDSTFTENYLLNKRDSVFRKNIEGPSKGSYMTTEHRLPSVLNIFEYRNNYAAEIRGLWKVENDFMGGPFVNLTVLDASKKRVIVLDGFVYAPRFDKRNYLRQVEAMIYSLKLPDQAENDKIKSQINMGN